MYKSVKMSQSKRLLCYPWSIVKNIGSWDLKFLKKKVCILFTKKNVPTFPGFELFNNLACIYIYIYIYIYAKQSQSNNVKFSLDSSCESSIML